MLSDSPQVHCVDAATPIVRQIRRACMVVIFWVLGGTICAEARADHLADTLLVVGPDTSASFLELANAVTDGIEASLSRDPLTLRYLTTQEMLDDAEDILHADTIVALGTEALRIVLDRVRSRQIYAALIPYAQAVETLASAPASVGLSIVTADQPDQRLSEIFTIALNGRKRVGVLYGETSTARINNLLDEFSRLELTLIPLRVYSDSSPAREIDRRHRDVDALLAIPDPAAVNRNTVRGVLQTSHRHGIPIVGYSQAFVDAGAIAAVYSSAPQIGQHLSELITSASLDATPDKRLLWPRYFSVSVNEQIAASLGMRLDSEDTIRAALEDGGPKR